MLDSLNSRSGGVSSDLDREVCEGHDDAETAYEVTDVSERFEVQSESRRSTSNVRSRRLNHAIPRGFGPLVCNTL